MKNRFFIRKKETIKLLALFISVYLFSALMVVLFFLTDRTQTGFIFTSILGILINTIAVLYFMINGAFSRVIITDTGLIVKHLNKVIINMEWNSIKRAEIVKYRGDSKIAVEGYNKIFSKTETVYLDLRIEIKNQIVNHLKIFRKE